MNNSRNHGKIQSTKTSFEIIHLLQKEGPSRLSEIADQLNIAESTTHRHLSTLHDLRYVSRQGELYQIGLRFARLGMTARTQDPAYAQLKPYVEKLADRTRERAAFLAEDHGLGIYIHQATGTQAVHVGTNIGRQIHLHCSSSGKAILSQYSEDRVNEIIDRWELPTNTENTITTRDKLFEELEQIREQGFAFAREEAVDGIHATAVPIKPSGRLIGALAIAGPSHRLQGDRFEEDLPNLLLATANELELNITYDEAEQPGEHIVE